MDTQLLKLDCDIGRAKIVTRVELNSNSTAHQKTTDISNIKEVQNRVKNTFACGSSNSNSFVVDRVECRI